MENDKLSEEELKAKLQKLSESETDENEGPNRIREIAMCYIPAPVEVKCDSCGKGMEEYFFNSRYIKDYVESIKALGYDAKVEFVCGTCAAKMGFKTESMYMPSTKRRRGFINRIKGIFSSKSEKEEETESNDILSYESDRMHIIFYFKAEGQEQYRITECSDAEDFKIVLNYLSRKAQSDSAQDEASPSDNKKRMYLTPREANVIREMTGLTV